MDKCWNVLENHIMAPAVGKTTMSPPMTRSRYKKRGSFLGEMPFGAYTILCVNCCNEVLIGTGRGIKQ